MSVNSTFVVVLLAIVLPTLNKFLFFPIFSYLHEFAVKIHPGMETRSTIWVTILESIWLFRLNEVCSWTFHIDRILLSSKYAQNSYTLLLSKITGWNMRSIEFANSNSIKVRSLNEFGTSICLVIFVFNSILCRKLSHSRYKAWNANFWPCI